MTCSENFLIEYAPPGIVRSGGPKDMTNFGIIYTDAQLTCYFIGEGIWKSEALEGYVIRLPKELSRLDPEDARAVWERVREHVQQQNPLHWHHRNVSMRPFSEVWPVRGN